MKTPIASVLAAALTAGAVLLPGAAQAAPCTRTIYAERAVTSAVSTTLYGRETSGSSTIYTSTTANDVMENLIASAVAQRNRVIVTGNALICPVAGVGFRNLGTILTITLSP